MKHAQHELETADYLKLSLQDTGIGMSEATKKHTFDPLYTTKQDSGGRGLGLSMVFGFINQSGGKIFIEPNRGYPLRASQFSVTKTH